MRTPARPTPAWSRTREGPKGAMESAESHGPRSGSGCRRYVASEARPRHESREDARGRAWRIWCAGPASLGPSWRHWPPPGRWTACSPTAARDRRPDAVGRRRPTGRPGTPAGGRWFGRRERPPRPLRTGCRAWSPDRVPPPPPPPPPDPHSVGGGVRRPVVARDGAGHHGHGVGPERSGPTGGGSSRWIGGEADRGPDHRRGRGHPPPTARERPRRRLLEPRGRDRHGQRRLLPWCLGPVEAGGPVVPGAPGAGPHRAVGRVGDPGGRAVRTPRTGPGPAVERFPVTFS